MNLPTTIAATLLALLLSCGLAIAATDGFYQLSAASTASWDGTDANLLKEVSADYDYLFGDDEYLTYTLPASWQFRFYGQTYSQITVDTNGNIWFDSARSAHSFNLANAGLGRVIAAWNDDLSSLNNGGVFIQHLTSPERVVIEWQTETLTDEGTYLSNNFEVVLFEDSAIRFDYKPSTAASSRDFGTGISRDDDPLPNTHYLSVTDTYGSPTTYATARSFLFTPENSGNNVAVNVAFTGSGSGMVTSTPSGISCNTDCSAPFTAGTPLTLHAEPSGFSLFGGWSGSSCSGTGDCMVTPADEVTATAIFTHDTAHQVRVDGESSTYYPSIQAAYDAVADGATIKLWATTYTESLTCGRPLQVTLLGGYDGGYTSITGEVVLNGILTISEGTVVMDGVSIR